MNSAYFMTNVIIPFKEAIFPQGRAPRERRLVVHLDNCSIHTSRVSTDRLEEYGFVRSDSNPIHLIWPRVPSTCPLRAGPFERFQFFDVRQVFAVHGRPVAAPWESIAGGPK
jgi:hypothetical protein